MTDTNIDIMGQTKNQVTVTIILGITSLICNYLQRAIFNIIAERQARAMRQALFHSILKQDIAYFDTHKTGELNSLLMDDVDKIRDGIGDKLCTLLYTAAFIISGVVIGRLSRTGTHLKERMLSFDDTAFVKGWKLTLVTLSVSPAIVMSFVLTHKVEVFLIPKRVVDVSVFLLL